MAEDSAGRRRRLNTELAEARAALKKHKRDNKRQAKDWLLSDGERATALAIYLLAEQNFEPVLPYLTGLGKMHHWSSLQREDMMTMMLDLFAATTDEELVQLVDAALTPYPEALRKAHGIVEPWKLKQWTKAKNTRGLKPPGVVLHIRAERERVEIPAAVRPVSWGIAGADASRQRLRRLRKRYGGRFGHLPMVPKGNAEEMRSKAIHCGFTREWP